jgi:predicted secreted protein
MSTNTIKAHAEHLRETNESAYNQMMAELAINGQTEYFRQTLCRNSVELYNLRMVRLIVAEIMKKYMPFTDRHFRENVLPELPKLETAA